MGTVSRALNPDTRHMVRAERAAQIVEAAERLGYEKDTTALGLRKGTTSTIGVAIPDIANSVFPPLIRGIEDELEQRGYMALLVNCGSSRERRQRLIDTLVARRVAGLVVASLEIGDASLDRLTSSGPPVVTVNRRHERSLFSSVTCDDDRGMGLMLEHLASLGHRQVASIAGPQDTWTGRERHKAFIRHAARLGLRVDPSHISFAASYSEDAGERSAEELLERARPFTAIAVSNDRLAVGVLAALQRRGVDCPGKVSVTGYNDMYLVNRLTPPLTTVRVDFHAIGKKAAELLLKHISQRASGGIVAPEHPKMKVELVVRGSTGPAARLTSLAPRRGTGRPRRSRPE